MGGPAPSASGAAPKAPEGWSWGEGSGPICFAFSRVQDISTFACLVTAPSAHVHTYTHTETHVGNRETRTEHKKSGRRKLLRSCRAALDACWSVEVGWSATKGRQAKCWATHSLPPKTQTIPGITQTRTHTHDERDKQGTAQGGPSALDLVGCSVNTKACSNTAPGPFLCESGNRRSSSRAVVGQALGGRLQSNQGTVP